MVLQVLLRVNSSATGLWNSFQWAGSLNYMGLVLAAVLLVLTNCVKATKGWHPIVFIGISAVAGIVLRFAAYNSLLLKKRVEKVFSPR